MKVWIKQYQYRAGLKQMTNILPGLQMAHCFKVLKFNSSMQDLVHSHLKQRAMQFSIKITFRALKRYG